MSLQTQVSDVVSAAVRGLFDVEMAVQLNVPEEQFGDFATNVAMQLAGKLGKSPREIAEQITLKLQEQGYEATIAGPGFINIRVTDQLLIEQATKRNVKLYDGESVIVEYSCPNYFKELHAGHLYNTLAGDVIARLIEHAGASVHRTNFGGDVGLHVAKAMFGILHLLDGEKYSHLSSWDKDIEQRSKFLSTCYVGGSQAYENEPAAKEAVESINRRVYDLHKNGDKDSDFAQIYYRCREWSREYFDAFYSDIRLQKQSDGSFFRYYPESETEKLGMDVVNEYKAKGVFVESNGAVVFVGEPFGLHTRVFITKQNLPTYETKDLGVMLLEQGEFAFDKRILITGRDQEVYMKVVWKAFEQIQPGVESKMTHLMNGIIKFGDGKKMSSRLGNVTRAVDVLDTVREFVGHSDDHERDERISLGAVKYEFLKHRLGGDIAFDPEESVSLQGNSGPYLQYALVRARSVLAKSSDAIAESFSLPFNAGERKLVRKLAEYQSVISRATQEYAPHHICTYLYELAQEFNRFYESNQVIGSEEESSRLKLVYEYAETLNNGLGLLGIEAPEKM